MLSFKTHFQENECYLQPSVKHCPGALLKKKEPYTSRASSMLLWGKPQGSGNLKQQGTEEWNVNERERDRGKERQGKLGREKIYILSQAWRYTQEAKEEANQDNNSKALSQKKKRRKGDNWLVWKKVRDLKTSVLFKKAERSQKEWGVTMIKIHEKKLQKKKKARITSQPSV